MKIKNIGFWVILVSVFFSCSSDNDISVPRNLGEFLETISNTNEGGVIACAANAEGRNDLTYIFYYPEEGATDIRYYEASSATVDKLDFTSYKRQALNVEDVFGGELQRFVRNNDDSESWCLVTYFLDGVLQISNPILLKNNSQQTKWENDLTIDYPTTLNPKFTWTDFDTPNNDVYFQVLFETKEEQFISGTYTEENTFSFYDTSNVTFNITTETPEDLKVDTEYLMTVMGVSQTDNWVNLIIEEKFVPQNLEEYLEASTFNETEKVTAFGVSQNESKDDSLIYFYPIENARDFRYYETESLNDDETDFSNYRRKFLDNDTDFGAQLRRFTRESTSDTWAIVTYEVDGEIYTSSPIKVEISSNPTKYETELTIVQTQTLLPAFSWSNFETINTQYLAILSENNNAFVSGFFVNRESYQYKNEDGVIGNINSTSLPDLILDDEYNITIYGLNENNWVNLVIRTSFEAK
jgi:hypothetical protein